MSRQNYKKKEYLKAKEEDIKWWNYKKVYNELIWLLLQKSFLIHQPKH